MTCCASTGSGWSGYNSQAPTGEMLRRFRIAAAIAALALALPGCRQAPVEDADPALWVVRDDDTTIYLFGTVHVLKPGLTWFDEAVRAAFNRSDTLVLELIMPEAPEMAALVKEIGTLPPGSTLPETLSPADRERLRAALAAGGVPPHALDRAEPWIAAITLAGLPLRKLGYRDTNGAEAVLAEAARQSGKHVVGLETPREQFGYFDRLSPAAQQALLQRTLATLPATGAEIERTVAAWRKGDADMLAAMLNAELKASPELADAVLVQRNRRWAEWIANRMDQPGTVFVAVGAGHLAGDASVQAELTKRGFKVARVRY